MEAFDDEEEREREFYDSLPPSSVSRVCTREDTAVINETREHAREERGEEGGVRVWRECTKPPY